MASSINASTAGAGGVITTADNSGILNLQSGGVTVATINSTGIVMASNTAPAFSAYLASNQSVTNATYTKVTFDTEEFDTNSNFASSRFTPTVAGYYQINSKVAFGTSAITLTTLKIYKNGSAYKQGTAGVYDCIVSSVVYLNGTTDYVEIYGYVNGVTPLFYGGSDATWFNGSFVRSA